MRNRVGAIVSRNNIQRRIDFDRAGARRWYEIYITFGLRIPYTY